MDMVVKNSWKNQIKNWWCVLWLQKIVESLTIILFFAIIENFIQQVWLQKMPDKQKIGQGHKSACLEEERTRSNIEDKVVPMQWKSVIIA